MSFTSFYRLYIRLARRVTAPPAIVASTVIPVGSKPVTATVFCFMIGHRPLFGVSLYARLAINRYLL
jgi:hypothetical protein